MKKLLIILACALLTLVSCTKSKEVHPEIGDGNDENITVGIKDVHVEYTRSDIVELSKVMFHYGPADANGHAQQFATAEMTKNTTYFELTLHELLSDTLYWYYYELFPKDGEPSNTIQKTFRTQASEGPVPPTPPVAELPSVITTDVVEITTNSAQCGGEVISDGGADVTERGICWSTNANPTISDSHIVSGSGTGAFTSSMTSLTANTTYHVRAYATNEAGTAYGLDKEFKTLIGGGGSDDHEYVDLGLPSGTLWATCNVGANSPEEYGDYFAWGETLPKDTYNWSTYQYCNGDYNQFTKYCYDSVFGYNGFTDDLSILLPEDDAATANWGEDWRMPFEGEWEELYNNTTPTWTTQNGVNGRRFTASNGNSLFLPAAGDRCGDLLSGVGLIGEYWSSSLDSYSPIEAGYFGFNSDNYGMSDFSRLIGFSVRPVRSSPQN